jgi:predicted nucleotidyltransferase
MFSTNKQKILIKFIESEPKEWYALELSKSLKISVGSANTLLKELEKENYLESKLVGKTILYGLKTENPITKQFKKLLNVEKARKDLAVLENNTRRVILFGSRASGNELPESDRDVLVVTEDRRKAHKIFQKSNLQNYKPIIMSPAEYIGLKSNNNVLYNETQKGVVIFENE